MVVSVKEQAVVFLLSILVGLSVGFLFDCFCTIRNAISKKRTVMGDAAFFIIAAFFLFWAIFRINDGAFRAFLWGAIGIGLCIYKVLLSSIVMKCSEKLLWLIRTIMLFFLKIILFPFRLLQHILKKPMITVIYPAKILRKNMHNSFKRLMKARKRKLEISKKIWKKI